MSISCVTEEPDNKPSKVLMMNKGYRPLCGFERRRDGSFIKRLNDPRSISSKESLQLEVKKIDNYPIIPFVNNDHDAQNRYYQKPLISYVSSPQVNYDKFIDMLTYNAIQHEGNLEIFDDVAVKNTITVPALTNIKFIKKLIINRKENIIKCWISRKLERGPDIEINNLFYNQ